MVPVLCGPQEGRIMIRIGPAGSDYKDWKGIVYPDPLPGGFHDAELLARYFDTVEINSTFYRPPSPDSKNRKPSDRYNYLYRMEQLEPEGKRLIYVARTRNGFYSALARGTVRPFPGTRTREMSIRKFAGSEKRPVGPGTHGYEDGRVSVAETCAGRRVRVRVMDP
jgi:hypothetical protein